MTLNLKEYATRHYSKADYDAVLKLWQDTGMADSIRADDATVIQHTLDQGGFLLLLEQIPQGKLAGTSWLTNDGRRAFLHHFGISPEFQGIGLANILMDASMEEIKKLGLQVKIEVHKDNHIAIGLYKKYGFKYLGDYNVYIIRDVW